MSPEGRTVLVTGANSGLGLADLGHHDAHPHALPHQRPLHVLALRDDPEALGLDDQPQRAQALAEPVAAVEADEGGARQALGGERGAERVQVARRGVEVGVRVAQLAGDEIDPKNNEMLVAAGFHRLGAVRRNAGNQEVASSRNEVLTERTDIIGAAFLGLTVGCARCHDHMFDPIRQKDYYRLQAYLGKTHEYNQVLVSEAEQERWKEENDRITKEIRRLGRGSDGLKGPAKDAAAKKRDAAVKKELKAMNAKAQATMKKLEQSRKKLRAAAASAYIHAGSGELTSENASGFAPFEHALAAGRFPKAVAVKGQMAGPITLAACLFHGERSFAGDRVLFEAVVARVSRMTRWQASRLRSVGLPVLLFLDEPTAGLDPIIAAGFDELVMQLKALLGLTVVMVTHDLDSLWRIADRVAVLGNGIVLGIGTMRELSRSEDPLIHEYFHGPRGRAAEKQHG